MNSQPHEPTVECAPSHCWTHNVDEPSDGYLLCGECGHMFLTPEELIAADLNWREESLAYGRMDNTAKDPEKIYSCPHCTHDF